MDLRKVYFPVIAAILVFLATAKDVSDDAQWDALSIPEIASIRGGACYKNADPEPDCPEAPDACGDIECIDVDESPTQVDWECPSDPPAKGVEEPQESYADCVSDSKGTYEEQSGDKTFYCWKTRNCKLDGCWADTAHDMYCSEGESTPQNDANSAQTYHTCVDAEKNSCP